MAEEQAIGADDVARKEFGTAFRGFDQYQVRAYLAQVAAELAALHERERALRERLHLAESRPPAAGPVSEDELEAALGVETTRVLHAAREAAAEIRARAEESVARLLREANDEAGKLRAEAEGVLGRRTEEAEAAATLILRSAEEAAAALRGEAEAAAATTIEEATTRGREMVAEAQAVRERVLKDLGRRRRAATQQLEQLLAGRERLLAAYDVVRENLELATRELSVAEDEARLAAEVAGFRPVGDDSGPVPAVEVPMTEVPVANVDAPDAPDAPAAPVEAVVEATSTEATPTVRLLTEPTADQLPSDGAPVATPEERRGSSLRLLRRKSESPEPPSLDEPVEGVRIIRPEPVVESPVVESPGRPVAVPDLPADEPDPEPALAEAVAEAPETPPVPAPGPEPEPASAEEQAPVDDLFARLRADRAAAVAQAEVVLAESSIAVLEAEDRPEAAEVTAVGEQVAVVDVVDEPAVDGAFERRDAAIEAAERNLTRAMKRALADEQNEVLDALRRLRGTPKLELLLPAADEHAARYATTALDHLVAAAVAGADAFGGAPPVVLELAVALGAELAEDLRSRLERTLDATTSDDEALVEGISATYREWKTSRSEPFARHHIAAAYGLGAFAAAPDGLLRWVVDPSEGGCPDCDDNALAGPTAKGDAFPTGQLHPPAHSGCRCVVLPGS